MATPTKQDLGTSMTSLSDSFQKFRNSDPLSLLVFFYMGDPPWTWNSIYYTRTQGVPFVQKQTTTGGDFDTVSQNTFHISKLLKRRKSGILGLHVTSSVSKIFNIGQCLLDHFR